MANEVRIRTTVDDKASRPLKGLQDSWMRLKKEGAQGLLAGATAAATVKSFDAIGVAASAAVDFIGDSIDKSRDLSETLSKSNVVFGQAAKGIETWGDTAAKSMGISKQAAIEAAATFGNFFTGLGQSQDEAAEMSRKLVGLASDLASFNNMDPNEVLDKLRAGLSGEAEPLRRVGVFLTEAKVKAKAMQMGLADTHGELSEGAKVLARYQIILDETKTAQGDFARTSEGLANSQRTATAQIADAQAELGKSFEPLSLTFTKLQIGLVENIKGLMRLPPTMNDAGDAAEKAADSTDILNRAMASRAEADGWSGAVGSAGRAASELEREAADAKKSVEDLADELVDKAEAIIDGYYDPIEMHEDLVAAKAERSSARRQLAAGKAGAKERRELRASITDQNKQIDKLSLNLLEAGKLSDKEKKEWIADLQERARKGGAATQRYVQKLIDKIHELDGMKAEISIIAKLRSYMASASKDDKVDGARASGGPVLPMKTYTVGENGPETLVMGSQGGFVIPNGGGMPMGVSGGMGGNINIYLSGLTYPPSSAQLQEMARVLGPGIRDYLNRRG